MRKIKINEAFVKSFFEKKDYKVIEIFLTGRSFVGIVRKQHTKFFFKFPKNRVVSKAVYNEYVWNKKLNPSSIKGNWPVHIPKVFDCGRSNGLFWFICEYFDQKNILSDSAKRWIVPNFIDKYLDNIVEFLLILQKVEIKLPNDRPNYSRFSFYDRKKINSKIMHSAKNFAKKTDYDCNPILKIIKKTTLKEVSLNQLDIKPWHFFKYKNKIALIDSEWASNKIVRFYDVASFYSRVHTILRKPKIANEFLKRYYGGLPQIEKKIFRKEIRALIGWIAIDELQDSILRKSAVKENYELLEKVEKDKLFEGSRKTKPY